MERANLAQGIVLGLFILESIGCQIQIPVTDVEFLLLELVIRGVKKKPKQFRLPSLLLVAHQNMIVRVHC